ncbi:hypothetical protein EGR_11057 [Echinococcus granulosus]|uniref:Uncharacterized protein n=1 Tax=Echinococcus granulosus TaxID=6210 RepID=W6TZ65_ECHGR|nr:hypothetical protein EGR_11057 [Echinococcus granulosus]EUB54085.1 hypothetical protein EGR_11057 [Echinococcus granulosus]
MYCMILTKYGHSVMNINGTKLHDYPSPDHPPAFTYLDASNRSCAIQSSLHSPICSSALLWASNSCIHPFWCSFTRLFPLIHLLIPYL